MPTEAEWEYAARAGTTTAYSWGERIRCSHAMYANHPSGADDCHDYAAAHELPLRGPAPVKNYQPNPRGLYDMHGNVWEIVADWYGPYAPGPQTDPPGAGCRRHARTPRRRLVEQRRCVAIRQPRLYPSSQPLAQHRVPGRARNGITHQQGADTDRGVILRTRLEGRP